MARPLDRPKNGFALSPVGDPLGVSCDAQGPSIGPIRLLMKTVGGFAPRRSNELGQVLSAVFGSALTYERLGPGLLAVARALDAGDMTRAIFATQFMRLPNLTEAQAQRAIAAERLIKAAADDEDHPGYPANEPGGKGGQFRPKDDAGGGDGGPIRPMESGNHAAADEEAPATQKTKPAKSPAVRRALGGAARGASHL